MYFAVLSCLIGRLGAEGKKKRGKEEEGSKNCELNGDSAKVCGILRLFTKRGSAIKLNSYY